MGVPGQEESIYDCRPIQILGSRTADREGHGHPGALVRRRRVARLPFCRPGTAEHTSALRPGDSPVRDGTAGRNRAIGRGRIRRRSRPIRPQQNDAVRIEAHHGEVRLRSLVEPGVIASCRLRPGTAHPRIVGLARMNRVREPILVLALGWASAAGHGDGDRGKGEEPGTPGREFRTCHRRRAKVEVGPQSLAHWSSKPERPCRRTHAPGHGARPLAPCSAPARCRARRR